MKRTTCAEMDFTSMNRKVRLSLYKRIYRFDYERFMSFKKTDKFFTLSSTELVSEFGSYVENDFKAYILALKLKEIKLEVQRIGKENKVSEGSESEEKQIEEPIIRNESESETKKEIEELIMKYKSELRKFKDLEKIHDCHDIKLKGLLIKHKNEMTAQDELLKKNENEATKRKDLFKKIENETKKQQELIKKIKNEAINRQELIKRSENKPKKQKLELELEGQCTINENEIEERKKLRELIHLSFNEAEKIRELIDKSKNEVKKVEDLIDTSQSEARKLLKLIDISPLSKVGEQIDEIHSEKLKVKELINISRSETRTLKKLIKTSLIEEKNKLRKLELSRMRYEFEELYGDECAALKIDLSPIFNLLKLSLDSFSFSFVADDSKLSMDEQTYLKNYCYETYGKFNDATKFIFEIFKIKADTRPRIPMLNLNCPIPPCMLDENNQSDAQEQNNNFIYGYPFAIKTQFPIHCCHPVFRDFMNIIDGNTSSKAFREYSAFIEKYINPPKNIESKSFDSCIVSLISTILHDTPELDGEREVDFIENLKDALEVLFPRVHVYSQVPITRSEQYNVEFKIDSAIYIERAPFIIVEARNMSYSIEAVLKGLQCYGLTQNDYIDNNPCFIITVDRGILHVYGVATVCQRVVCDCLVSFEVTNYHFNINNFLTRFYRCITGLFFFFEEFRKRVESKFNDPQHLKYNKLKHFRSADAQPLPAIFDIKAWKSDDNCENDNEIADGDSDRISITFKEIQVFNHSTKSMETKANLQKNVFLVKTEHEEDAILKICSNYNIRVHEILAKEKLAPRIIGYEKLCENCHVVLMEYLDPAKGYMSVHKYCHKKDSKTQLKIIELLKDLLKRIQDKRIVHGDFRCVNVYMKMNDGGDNNDYDRKTLVNNNNNNSNNSFSYSDSDDSDSTDVEIVNPMEFVISESTFDFKIIDFEFSGMEGELYPCLVMKNHQIKWHSGFRSFAPRRFSHDEHLLQKMMTDF